MFDAADLIALPGLVPGAGDGGPTIDVARDRVAGVETASAAAGGVLNRNLSHVIEACAMRGHDVALAMSNGELCHANISKRGSAAEELVPTEDTRWPKWTSWPTRHGKILSLQYDPAHDALVTIEVRAGLTAFGLQIFSAPAIKNILAKQPSCGLRADRTRDRRHATHASRRNTPPKFKLQTACGATSPNITAFVLLGYPLSPCPLHAGSDAPLRYS